MLPITSANVDSGKQLTTMQEAFVDAFVSNGGDKVQAAIDAGYSEATARNQASELLHKPHIMQAIMARTMSQLVMQSPVAARCLSDLMEAKSEYVRLQAAQDVLNRIGIKAPDRVDHRVHGDVTVNIDLS